MLQIVKRCRAVAAFCVGPRMAVVVVALLLPWTAPALAGAFQSPMHVPAVTSALAARSPLMAVARAGQRIVAAGIRGHIVFSDDEGETWKQASVPVSTDLVALSFAGPSKGWAVGHGGVVLHTRDAGATWIKQIDGDGLSALAQRYYEQRMAGQPSPADAKALQQAKALASDGSTKALLDVYFQDERTGYVVGTFNRIFRTDDGGASWTPWMERSGNSRELHFYSIRNNGGRIQLTGEQGTFWEIDPARGVLLPIPTPYTGTLFGSIEAGPNLFVYGMRGSLFRSGDRGKSWTKVALAEQAGITGGMVADGGKLVLATQAGRLLLSDDGGASFHSVKLSDPMPYFGIGAASSGKLVLVGSQGVRSRALRELVRK